MSIEDKRFIQTMESQIHKNKTGHWEMPLPLRSNDKHFPNNKGQAATRLKSLLHSFQKNPKMERDYFDFMAKLFERGHAKPVPFEADPSNESGKVWYLPHFGIYHPRKPNKIRVVFDSSAEYEGTSLNKELLSGPDMHNNLLGILIRFRRYAAGVMCDIKQMFHNFHVHPPHRDLLRFLWFANNDKEKEIVVYQMLVHLFGNTSSPAVATFGLRKTAEEGENEFGRDGKDFVVEDFYVDGGLTSRPTPKETVSLVRRTQAMLATANLNLHKIASNSVEVMKSFPEPDQADSLKDLHFEQGPLPSQRSLGVMWDLQEDTFTFRITLMEKSYTRRVTLQGRLLLRELTKLGHEGRDNKKGLGWDDALPQPLLNRWNCWRESLHDLENIQIPRCYRSESFGETKRSEIHAFSDASDKAIGTVIYLKQENHSGGINVSLMFAQAKLSPKQATTIPRLKLCAAVLAVNAVKWITRQLRLDIDEILFYTDSRVVLGYIQNEHRRFYVYVANRVQIIRNMSDPSQWRYVETANNPADIATRGKPAEQLMPSSWFRGPDFLRNDQTPSTNSTMNEDNHGIIPNDPEVWLHHSTYYSSIKKLKGLGSERFAHFSKWSMLRRALANLIVKLKKFKARRRGEISSANRTRRTCSHSSNLPISQTMLMRSTPSATDMKQAETIMMKAAQTDAFSSELQLIRQSQPLKNSHLYNLDPFIDDDGVLRVGGCLRRANQLFEEKHPAILPRESHLAYLAIDHYHEIVHHQGRQITHGKIRQAGIWIIGGSRMVTRRIKRCVICRRLRGKLLTQHMASLPRDRLETPPPFTNVGFDVFGPWTIQVRKLRGGAVNAKRWGLLFMCLICRAVHIEVLETMETSSFICALRRFFALRGPPSLLRCDRGTNFIGGKTELDQALSAMDQKAIQKYVAEQNCEWLFNPPHASHFGGIWERQIGTARRVLDAMFLELGSPQLTHELLVTLMAEVTGIINSRPIAVVPSDIDQPHPLTPNMLLTMKVRPLLFPPGVFTPEDIYSRRHWRRSQYLADQFWTRWKREYLQCQQRRVKWNEKRPNLKEGDIVILKDPSPRNRWPLGRVVEVILSEDGRVRKAKVAITKDGEKKVYYRPISELVSIMHT